MSNATEDKNVDLLNSRRFKALKRHVLLPPIMLKAFHSGKYVLHQKDMARPGQDAAFLPWGPIYQFEQSPAKTVFCKPW